MIFIRFIVLLGLDKTLTVRRCLVDYAGEITDVIHSKRSCIFTFKRHRCRRSAYLKDNLTSITIIWYLSEKGFVQCEAPTSFAGFSIVPDTDHLGKCPLSTKK